MKNEQLVTQLELYSNSIVGFFVVQALTYSASFGTSELFNCLVKTANYLALGLSAHFFFSTLLACYAIWSMQSLIAKRCKEIDEDNVIRKIYFAKCLVVVLFAALPFAITVGYGVMDYPNKMHCKQTVLKI